MTWPHVQTAWMRGEFAIDAIQMRVVNCADPEESYSGGGLVQQTDLGLEFKLFDPGHVEGLGPEFFNALPAGRWLEDRDFYDLELQDTKGRLWRSKRVFFDPSIVFDHPGLVGKGRIQLVECEGDVASSGGDYMWMFFPGDIKIPTNSRTQTEVRAGSNFHSRKFSTNVWEFVQDGWRFHFQIGSRGMEAMISSDSRFPPGFDTRVEESLWFVLGREIQWSALYRSNPDVRRITLRPGSAAAPITNLGPPLEFRGGAASITHAADISRMFLAYLDRVVEEGPEGRYHPTSSDLRRILTSGSFAEQQALNLAVAVESVTHRHFYDHGTPSSDMITALDAFRDYSSFWEGPDDIEDADRRSKLAELVAKRIAGALGSWKKWSPKKAFRELRNEDVIGRRHTRAWDDVRNPSAHGDIVLSDDREAFREFMGKCATLHQMLLRLLFKAIGYEGRFTDRTKVGHPTATFSSRTVEPELVEAASGPEG